PFAISSPDPPDASAVHPYDAAERRQEFLRLCRRSSAIFEHSSVTATTPKFMRRREWRSWGMPPPSRASDPAVSIRMAGRVESMPKRKSFARRGKGSLSTGSICQTYTIRKAAGSTAIIRRILILATPQSFISIVGPNSIGAEPI
ncbi:MAG: hypothetical protein LKG59_07685, partial [Atopobiaceae bacterium]|nr:hypothetical protein [Atopobiaceae bacterium]